MALDWIAGHRPKAGHEVEFQEIVATLFWDRLGTADSTAASRAGRNRLPRALFGRTSAVRKPSEALRKRYDAIGILASDTLGMLRGGDDAGGAAALSFDAQGLTATTAIIGDHLLRACYEVKYAPDLSAFGNALSVRVGAFVKAKGLDVPALPPPDSASPEGQLHIVDAASRWCRFWGERGHLLVPSF